MSAIEKMSIMGIRSFGPEDQNKQLIEFFKPLTLILGPNGSGKTTIIECLRYMTTGDTPPNSDRGCSFVHDPKIAGETEVKAQVKLKFRDVLDKKVVVTRSLLATQKAKKISFKTLDGTITRYTANNEATSLSTKCAEIDAEMITSLGVSKAILNNVIFCHQEDSNWPLSEGKALKTKFDEIFAATRYIKALDEIKKIRQEHVQNIKVYKTQVENLKSQKRKADEFAKELESTHSRLAASKDTIHSLEDKLKPILEKLREITVQQNEIGSLQTSLENNMDIISKYEKDEQDLKGSIKILFDGEKDDLIEEIRNFTAQVSCSKKQLEKIKQKSSDLEYQRQSDLKVKSRLLEELGKLKSDHQRHLDHITSRDARLREVRKNLGLGGLGFDEDEALIDSQVENVIKNLQQRNAATQNELANSKAQYEAKENAIQSEIDKNRIEKAQLQQKLSSSNEQIAKNRFSIRNINAQLIHVDSLASRQDDLEEELKETVEELNTLESSIDANTLKEQIINNQRKKEELENKYTNLNEEMRQLQKESKIRTEIDILNKDISSKQESIDKMLQRHQDSIIHLLQEMPTQGVHEKITKFIVKLDNNIRELNENLKKERSNLSSLETAKRFHIKQLSTLETTLSENQNKIFDICGSQDFDFGLEALQNTIKELQDEKGALTGSLYLFNKYIEKLGNPRPCCPLCTRSFETNTEAQALIQRLQGKLQSVPSSLDQKTQLISEKQEKLNRMLELRPIKEAIKELTDKEIPNLKAQIETVVSDIVKSSSKITEMEEILDHYNNDIKIASNIVPDLTGIEINQREIEKQKRKITNLNCQLGRKDISRTIQQVSDEQNNMHEQMKYLSREIESAQQRINDHREHVQRLRSRINDINAEKVKIANDTQKKNSLFEQLSSLEKENLQLIEVVKQVKTEIASLETKIKHLIKEKEEIKKQKEFDLEKIRNKIKAEEKEMEKIDKLTQDINNYIKEKKEEILINHEEKLKVISSEIEKKMAEINKYNKEEKDLNKEVTTQELKYRDLEDNLKLKETLDKIEQLKIKCNTLRQKIGGYDIRSLLSERDRLLREEKKLTSERDESIGREKLLREKIKDLKKQLDDEMFKDADKKHREMCIELRTTELACEDLSKYHTALNKAILSYHQMKMAEINKIIRDLWMKTYAGNDIDYIEIHSNEDESNAGLEKAKRQYDYKVVMYKGDHITDMRSRCSAGQKVLASLIIRLALAETFCLNCGIMALDEPTTNLDRENISGLARALVDIVENRLEQKNFQLVIITHDEDFIHLLGRSGKADYFYKVSKDVNAFSVVRKCFITDIN